jgi:beta-lactam-binding protein with PASTA domain
MVLAQTPPPNAGVDQPRVNLLLSSSASASSAFVLPSFTGMTLTAANREAIALGLRVAVIDNNPPPPTPTPATPGAPAPAPAAPTGIVSAQSPESGFRATRGDILRLTLAHTAQP